MSFSTKLSTAALVGATAKTLKSERTAFKITSLKTLVFPVPGGPCTTVTGNFQEVAVLTAKILFGFCQREILAESSGFGEGFVTSSFEFLTVSGSRNSLGITVGILELCWEVGFSVEAKEGSSLVASSDSFKSEGIKRVDTIWREGFWD